MPDIREEDIRQVTEVLQSGKLSIGPVIDAFEMAFAEKMRVNHAIAVSSGTSALHMAVRLAQIGAGQEVIVSPFSFVASANCVLFENATPVFVDIEEHRLGIDPDKIDQAINAQTRAILPTHIFGKSCAVDKLSKIAQENNLLLIEDNCESPGATLNIDDDQRLAGSFGEFSAYGFYPNKLVTTGEGGMLTTNDHNLASMARSLRNQGRGVDNGMHMIHERLGYNYRMSEIQAALGLSQLNRLEESIAIRNRIASSYHELLKDEERVKLLDRNLLEINTYFVYAIRVDKRARDKVIQFLDSQGIQTKAYFYPCIHLHPHYRQRFGFKEGDFPVAEQISKEIIALPIFNQMSDFQIEKVVSVLKQALDLLL